MAEYGEGRGYSHSSVFRRSPRRSPSPGRQGGYRRAHEDRREYHEYGHGPGQHSRAGASRQHPPMRPMHESRRWDDGARQQESMGWHAERDGRTDRDGWQNREGRQERGGYHRPSTRHHDDFGPSSSRKSPSSTTPSSDLLDMKDSSSSLDIAAAFASASAAMQAETAKSPPSLATTTSQPPTAGDVKAQRSTPVNEPAQTSARSGGHPAHALARSRSGSNASAATPSQQAPGALRHPSVSSMTPVPIVSAPAPSTVPKLPPLQPSRLPTAMETALMTHRNNALNSISLIMPTCLALRSKQKELNWARVELAMASHRTDSALSISEKPKLGLDPDYGVRSVPEPV